MGLIRVGIELFFEAFGDLFRSPERRVEVNTERAASSRAAIEANEERFLASDRSDSEWESYEITRRSEQRFLDSYNSVVARNGGTRLDAIADIAFGAMNMGVGIGAGGSGSRVLNLSQPTAAIASSTGLAIKVHGNSLLSPQAQTIYNLISINGGAIQKIGITATQSIAKRYSPEVLERSGVVLLPVMQASNRLLGIAFEKAALAGYMGRNGGRMPPLQVNFGAGPF